MIFDRDPFDELTPVDEGEFRYVTLNERFVTSLNVVRAGARVLPHAHDQDVYNFVMCGEIRLTSGGETRACPAGTWVFIPAGQDHGLESPGGATLLELWKK